MQVLSESSKHYPVGSPRKFKTPLGTQSSRNTSAKIPIALSQTQQRKSFLTTITPVQNVRTRSVLESQPTPQSN